MDVHIYTNLINVHVRCNDIPGAEDSLRTMIAAKITPNVVTYTTLLKGYCESGMMTSAKNLLLTNMLPEKAWNVRSLSTFLRGCVRVGSVNSALEVFQSCLAQSPDIFAAGGQGSPGDPKADDGNNPHTQEFSCYESIIGLLCRSGRIKEADDLLRSYISSSTSVPGGSHAAAPLHKQLFEDVGLYVILTKACALSGLENDAKKYLKLALESLSAEENSHLTNKMKLKFDDAWNNESSTTGSERGRGHRVVGNNKENKSLQLFRLHKCNEIKMELNDFEDYLSAWQSCNLKSVLPEGFEALESREMSLKVAALKEYFAALEKLLYFGSDGVGDLKPDEDSQASSTESPSPEDLIVAIVMAAKQKFGLKASNFFPLFEELKSSHPSLFEDLKKLLRQYELESMTQLSSTIDQQRGKIDLKKLFNVKGKDSSVPIKLEIGAGNGDWVVAQAAVDRSYNSRDPAPAPAPAGNAAKKAKPKGYWLAVELRCDRVNHIFSRNIVTMSRLSGVYPADGVPQNDVQNNLAILGGDAAKILPRLPENSISAVFINYPQPPERVQGVGEDDNKNQGQHLLTRGFFQSILAVLKTDGGRMTLLTDNLSYGQSLAAILSEISSKDVGAFFKDCALSEAEQKHIDWTIEQQLQVQSSSAKETITLWRGDPGPEGGHIADSSSYFDRMWSLGQKKRRWFLFVEKSVYGGQ